ncbi:hypothetical protein M438DRAFT_193000 [Aureobasidium pullulans EXF-150]|uniref:Uncharacterized protein n=1 Tax=Aureobasidium pullulans EXF-150 TaxID=1043002 RepID=A0A074XIE8_AURPU|nr:uncharacterized protein M438DRAFT_193000 [Aureobasidium pullulans EXF-150]KEQ85280.1 hypothetical protein M438DRAFT_193000 [Aureobasidium pullulans EXF-150]
MQRLCLRGPATRHRLPLVTQHEWSQEQVTRDGTEMGGLDSVPLGACALCSVPHGRGVQPLSAIAVWVVACASVGTSGRLRHKLPPHRGVSV